MHISPGCCGLRCLAPLRRGQLLGAAPASSATRPTTSPATCPGAFTVATPSARPACGGWTAWHTHSAGCPARSAARAPRRPAGGWLCWTWTCPPSWLCVRNASPRPLPPPKAAQPSHSSQLGLGPAWVPSHTFPEVRAAAGAGAAFAGRLGTARKPEVRLLHTGGGRRTPTAREDTVRHAPASQRDCLALPPGAPRPAASPPRVPQTADSVLPAAPLPALRDLLPRGASMALSPCPDPSWKGLSPGPALGGGGGKRQRKC